MANSQIADTSGQDVQVQRKPRTLLWVGLAAGALLLLGAAIWFAPAVSRWSEAEISIPADRVRVAQVARGDLTRDVSVQGRVVAAVSPTLYAPQTGTITFAVEAGATVVAGAILATIDSPEVTNQLEQEQANLSRFRVELERQAIQGKQRKLQNRKTVDLAEVALTAARRESRRADEAFEKEAISQLDFEKAQDELRSAELSYEHAVADAALDNERLDFELKTMQLDIDRQDLLVADWQRQVDELALRSPVSGIVGNLLVQQKTNVSRNQAVLAVVDLSGFKIEAQVPESYSDDLAVGMAAEIRIGSATSDATLIAVSPEIIDSQVTVELRFEGSTPPGLRQNQRLTTRLLLESKTDVVLVARGQFLESGGGRIAYVVNDQVARRTAIEVGSRSLNAVEIIGGLKPGQTIIVSSTEAFDGAQSVLITN